MDKKLLRIHSVIHRNVRQLPITNKNIAVRIRDFPIGKETEVDISIFSPRRVRVTALYFPDIPPILCYDLCGNILVVM